MKFKVKYNLVTADEGEYSDEVTIEAENIEKAEKEAYNGMSSYEDGVKSYDITDLKTKETYCYYESKPVSKEKIQRLNGIYANAYPDLYDEV